jgi:hypothetical protein
LLFEQRVSVRSNEIGLSSRLFSGVKQMSDYLEDVKKYVDAPNPDAIDSLVGHLGIALENRDSAMVAASDPEELKKIRDGYCNTNLDLDADEADSAIQKVCEMMKEDRSKNRVTFYYLLAHLTDRMHRLC